MYNIYVLYILSRDCLFIESFLHNGLGSGNIYFTFMYMYYLSIFTQLEVAKQQ